MNKTFYILLSFVIIPICFSACCKRKVYCKPGSLRLAFVGFQRSEVRAFVLRRYEANDTVRKKALDSAQFVYSGTTPVVPNKKDTVWMSDYVSNGAISSIYYGNDWTISLTAINGRFAITTIFDDENESQIAGCNDNEASCVNNISHFSLNGAWHDGNTAYIVK